MNRRDLLAVAPAIGMMAAAPASAAAPSSIISMFRDWERLRADEDAYSDLVTDTPESAEATRRVLAIEDRIRAAVPTDTRDFVAKVLVMTVNGLFYLPDEGDLEFWAEARGLIEVRA
ncbi:hypothetical protein [Paenirhodobacter enshiensis]|uniref:hypothetical protein n=1 Tax=Paenirhodobacter enshiensis TaxID=1105367 RepID=UPI0035B14E80